MAQRFQLGELHAFKISTPLPPCRVSPGFAATVHASSPLRPVPGGGA